MADRRAFALILALIASGAVFALAMQGAVHAREALVEAGAIRDRAALQRDARSAVTIVVAGLTSALIDPETGEEIPLPSGPGAGGDQPNLDEEGGAPEMPPVMRELLGQLKGEEPQEPSEDADASPGSLTPTAPERRPAPAGRDDRLRAVGVPTPAAEVVVSGRALRVAVIDAGGLLDVNRADEDHLIRYFTLCGVDDDTALAIAHQLLDWRDEDDFVRPRGGERADYERRGVTIRNGPLRALEEMLYLPAMTPERFERVRHALVVGGDGSVHAPTAPREVLLSLPGMTDAVGQQILDLRAQGLLNRETLASTLATLPPDTQRLVRLAIGARLRAVVTPAQGPGPRISVDFVVTPRQGIQFLSSEVH